MNVSKLFKSVLNDSMEDGVKDAIKNIRKSKNFKKLDKGVKAKVEVEARKRTVDKIVDGMENKSSDFAKKFGTKFTMNTEGTYDDLGKRIGQMRESRVKDGVAGVRGQILNPKRATKDVNFVKPTTKDITGSKVTENIKIPKEEGMSNVVFNNVTATGLETKEGFVPIKTLTSYTADKDGHRIKGVSTSKQTPEKPDVKNNRNGNGNNWVYKMAAAGVGGGLVLSMSNNRGQQPNSQLYGQGGY